MPSFCIFFVLHLSIHYRNTLQDPALRILQVVLSILVYLLLFFFKIGKFLCIQFSMIRTRSFWLFSTILFVPIKESRLLILFPRVLAATTSYTSLSETMKPGFSSNHPSLLYQNVRNFLYIISTMRIWKNKSDMIFIEE